MQEHEYDGRKPGIAWFVDRSPGGMLELIVLIVVFAGSAISLRFALSTGFATRLAVDAPNRRSLHSTPIPRGGGLFFLPWSIAGAMLVGGRIEILGMAAALGILSLIDDRRSVPVYLRLAVHLAVAFAAASALNLESTWGWLVVAIGVAWMMNLYNFMDGSDGLAGGMAAIGFGVYAIAAWAAGEYQLSLISFCLVAGASAFLFFNFPPAKIFMGDVGSIPLGFLAAALGFYGWHEGVWPLWFPILVFSPFIVDSTVTLLRRLLRRERFWEAHRDHAYQRLIRSGWSHLRLMSVGWSVMLLTGATALMLIRQPAPLVTAGLAGWAALYAILLIAVEARWRRTAVAQRGSQ